MKVQKFLFVFLAFLISTNAVFAANGDLMNQIALGAILVILLLIGVVCMVLLNTFKVLSAIILKPELEKEKAAALLVVPELVVSTPEVDKITFWQKVLSLRPLSEEKDMLEEHDYDGIKELNNPTPGWFMYLFYFTIIFGFVYLLNYHVFKIGNLQEEEYAIELKQAEISKKAFLAKSANNVDENNIKISNTVAVLNDGKAIFLKNCVACHGEKGQGTVGPNLTDEYWIHGGKIGNIFKTVKYGVPEKGMISWEKQLTPKQMADVANYIKSLANSNPPNPKEQQGVKET